MKTTMTVMFAATLIILSCSSCNAQKKGHATVATPTPAPAPAPHYANLTELLSVAGPFHTFLGYLQSTKVIDTLQAQANDTEEGLTLFVPKDSSFASLKKPSLSNLTQEQLKQLCLFHALPHYYSLADFKNLSNVGPVPSFAGGDYTLNFTDVSGTIHMTTGWSVTKISSSVYSTAPVAIYQVNKVLLPEAIFGDDIPPTPAPAPAPEATAPAADAPGEDSKDDKAPMSSKDSSGSGRVVAGLVLAVSGMVVMCL
ncbi:hypothetical protein RND81_14G006900 [Saponaria officinalis]|uniref:FAS1 domain-containing protein n=1 Tax=Saponaria officinalis TaxID=3572 RepID=A0AAW1GJM7_SAPOF